VTKLFKKCLTFLEPKGLLLSSKNPTSEVVVEWVALLLHVWEPPHSYFNQETSVLD